MVLPVCLTSSSSVYRSLWQRASAGLSYHSVYKPSGFCKVSCRETRDLRRPGGPRAAGPRPGYRSKDPNLERPPDEVFRIFSLGGLQIIGPGLKGLVWFGVRERLRDEGLGVG